MSLTLKRTCPFTLTINPHSNTHTLMTMDADLYKPRCRSPFREWEVVSPKTMYPTSSIPEESSYTDTSRRSPSPPKRPRNTKNLSLTVPVGPKNCIPTSSAPPTPFRSPRLPTRRPSNLTINIHSLHRHPSTPELHAISVGSPLVSSPTPYTSQRFLSLGESRRADSYRTRYTDPSIAEIPYEESVEREKAYPDGPRLIIEPNIWLYAAPDRALAKTYDLVVNVAREVNNPFLSPDLNLEPPRLSPESDTETTPSPFSPLSSSANQSPSVASSASSGYPQSMSRSDTGKPVSYKYEDVEYMHIPWEHNSSLSHELPGIVDYILERSAQGKKVLVHCQVLSHFK